MTTTREAGCDRPAIVSRSNCYYRSHHSHHNQTPGLHKESQHGKCSVLLVLTTRTIFTLRKNITLFGKLALLTTSYKLYMDYRFNGIMYKKTGNLQFDWKVRWLVNSFHRHVDMKARLVDVCGWLAGRRQVTVNAKGVVYIYRMESQGREPACSRLAE